MDFMDDDNIILPIKNQASEAYKNMLIRTAVTV